MRPVEVRPTTSTFAIALFIVAISLAALLTACASTQSSAGTQPLADTQSPATLAGMVRSPLANVADVSVPDVAHGGTDFAMRADEGHLLIVYFGYTSCPDVCPTTMSDLRRAVADLGDDSARIDVAFLTIDPMRDLPELITTYVQRFFPDASALRTEDQELLVAAAKAFGAGFEITVDADGNVLDVNHTAFLYAVDSDGMIQVQWPFGMTSEDMANDMTYLLERPT